MYPFGLACAAEALVSLKRIEEFLLKEDKSETELGLDRRNSMVIVDTKRKHHTIHCLNFY